MKPTDLLEQVASLRRNAEAQKNKLHREKGALAQIKNQLQEHFGTDDSEKIRKLVAKDKEELAQLLKKGEKLKREIEEVLDEKGMAED